jgi:hypothetical protein
MKSFSAARQPQIAGSRRIAASRPSRRPPSVAAAHSTTATGADAGAVSKRALLLSGLSGLALAAAAPARAGEHSGVGTAVVDWWKGRQTLNGAKLIAPIKVAQRVRRGAARRAAGAAHVHVPCRSGAALPLAAR